MKQVHNLNNMRPALVEARRLGNRTAISNKLCDGLKISTAYFSSWVEMVSKLQANLSSYIVAKHSSVSTLADDKTLKALGNRVFESWKELLECSEPEKDSNVVRPRAQDIEDLVGYATKFRADSNAKGGVKMIALEAETRFRREVETLIGIRMADADVMTNAVRDWLDGEKKILKSIRIGQKAKEKRADDIESLMVMVSKSGDLTAKKVYEADIARIQGEITEIDALLERLEVQLAEHMAKKAAAYGEEVTEKVAA